MISSKLNELLCGLSLVKHPSNPLLGLLLMAGSSEGYKLEYLPVGNEETTQDLTMGSCLSEVIVSSESENPLQSIIGWFKNPSYRAFKLSLPGLFAGLFVGLLWFTCWNK